MTLPLVQLDDLDWGTLTQSSRESIAGASSGQWTLHSPVDPGVTLLELFASQLEQRLFWMDAPSDSLDTAILKLHGVHSQPVQASRTVLTCGYPCENIGSTALQAIRLKRHSVFEQQNADRDRRFRTLRTIQLLPFMLGSDSSPSRRGTAKRFHYQSPEWMYQKSDHSWPSEYLSLNCNRDPLVFQPANDVIGTRIRFKLRDGIKKLSIEEKASLSFLFDLETPENIDPQWKPSKRKNGLLREGLVWRMSVETNNDSKSLIELPLSEKHNDGTLGMVRSGIVELRTKCATVHRPTAVILELSMRGRPFSFLPRFNRIVPNAVMAENRVRLEVNAKEIQSQVQAWYQAKLPGNRIDLSLVQDQFVIPDSSMKLRIQEEHFHEGESRTRVWRYTPSFSSARSTSRVFTFDRSAATITFGDGIHGRIPRVEDSSSIEIRCDIGGGSDGNVAKDRSFEHRELRPSLQAFNAVAAIGGAEAETNETAFRRLRRELAFPTRSVTKADLELICVNSGLGIGRADAIYGMHPHFPTIETPGAIAVLVVPDLPASLRNIDFLQSKDDLIAIETEAEVVRAVERQLDKARLLGDEIFIRSPLYVPIEVRVTLMASSASDYDVRKWMSRTLSKYLHPLVGGPDQTGWPIGHPLIPSELQRILREDEEFGSLIREVAIRRESTSLDAKSDFEACRETSIPRDALPALRDIQLKLARALEMGVLS